jgi:hypothetical protein
MFASTTLAYPCVLALLCTGAGLLADRLSGGGLAGALLPAVGVATLIAVSQLTTYLAFAAPATPYLIALVALAGLIAGRSRLSALARSLRGGGSRAQGPRGGGRREQGPRETGRSGEDQRAGNPPEAVRGRACWPLAGAVLVYAVALAPVLAAGRPTFSSFQALTDSAFHMLGADYLMHHGQDYAGLDLRNSYGQYLHAYYASGYPSGADTLFGGSSFLVGLPLIWTFQPFNAFVLATAFGPAWMLARRIGLTGGWAALAAVTALLGALVYGYELVASVKEIVALAMLLTLGALAVERARWLWRPAGVCAFALALAAGVAALGIGFCAWGLGGVIVVGAAAIGDVRAGRQSAGRLAGVAVLGIGVVVVGALGTWAHLSDSLQVAHGIATTSNPGNLTGSLEPAQAFGTWLTGAYQEAPTGWLLDLSYAIAALTLVLAVLGAIRIVSLGEHALAVWVGLILAAGVVLGAYATAWVSAKTIMLTSPIVVLLAWGGIAGLRASAGAGVRASAGAGRRGAGRAARLQPRSAGRTRRTPALAATLAALIVAGGVAVSDAMQYHAANLAPTARYEELAAIGRRFAGHGPALVGDFDEYALYELRGLDVGGLDFMYPPVGLRTLRGHGYPVDLDHVPAAAWDSYPLAITRRDPTVSEPPSAYRLVWQGAYYQVWRRRPGAPVAIAHLGLSPGRPARCASVARLARLAAADGARLIAAVPPETVQIDVAGAKRPAHWKRTHPGLVMSGAGRLESVFTVPRSGVWELWLKGELMPTVTVSVDGRRVAAIGGELDGNPHNPEPTAPVAVRLSAGAHVLSIARGGGPSLAPGAGGWAILHEAFLTPAGADTDTLVTTPPSRWTDLCGRRYDWIEVAR